MPLSKVDFERMEQQEGRPITLLRRGTPDIIVPNIQAKDTRAQNSPSVENISGGMVEDMFMITCTTIEMELAGFPVPPVVTDRLLFDGEYHNVTAVYMLYLATVLAGYKIQVMG